MILSEFLTRRVVQEYPIPRGKISIFATFGGHLGFLRKMKKCEYCISGYFRVELIFAIFASDYKT